MTSTVYLGIDYGRVRIGVAIARGPLAEPYQIIPGGPGAVDQLGKLCGTLGVRQLIVGLSAGKMATETQAFAAALSAKTGLPVSFVDENHSSIAVSAKLSQGAANSKTKHGPIDHLVASELLQQWMDDNLIE